MSGLYERVGSIPDPFSVMVRWNKSADSVVAQRLFALPRTAPEVIRRVLDDALATGRLDAIVQEVEAQKRG